MSVIVNMLNKAKKKQVKSEGDGNSSLPPFLAARDEEPPRRFLFVFLLVVAVLAIIAVICVIWFKHHNMPASKPAPNANQLVVESEEVAVVPQPSQDQAAVIEEIDASQPATGETVQEVMVEEVPMVSPAASQNEPDAPTPNADINHNQLNQGSITPAEKAAIAMNSSDSEILFAINQDDVNKALALMGAQSGNKKQYAVMQHNIISNLLLSGRNKVALMFGQQAINYVPENLSLRLLTAGAAYRLKDYNYAYNALNAVHPPVAGNEKYYALKGVLSIKLEKYKSAQSVYRSLIKLNPTNPSYLLGLATAEQGLGNTEMALVYYSRLKNSQDPTWPSWYFVNQQIQRLQ